jgi:hypothetical protein
MLRTLAAGEYCESIIRQRCSCKISSSVTESSSGPYPTPRIEDVHSIDERIRFTCTRHQQSAAAALANFATRKHPSPNPTCITPCNSSLQHMLRTKYAAGEYCESIIRQRCGCKIPSSDTESSSGPYPTPRIEDVHSIDRNTCTCARHQRSAAAALANFATRKHPSPNPTYITPCNQ